MQELNEGVRKGTLFVFWGKIGKSAVSMQYQAVSMQYQGFRCKLLMVNTLTPIVQYCSINFEKVLRNHEKMGIKKNTFF
jgi:hypothetical protein